MALGADISDRELSDETVPLPDGIVVGAGNLMHAPSLSPENPWVHMQSKSLMLAEGDVALVGHLLQAPLPTVSLYVPSSQAKQVSAWWLVYPVLQVHLVSALLPVSEFVFVGHDKQGAGPGLDLNAPAKQNSHGPPSGPEEPAGHCTEH
mmetsp:Transcript_89752/g.131392  ORF Transcript_89752/g.131392 Transcript_89752/m.131392 type:complete len:149 (-) Transcript_89752:949-1395(-)